jgi:CarD family transcriptional regulator
MHFTQGQTVVHPHHGPATVHSITTRTVRNVESRYVILKIQDRDLVTRDARGRLRSGDIYAVAGVVHNLLRRSARDHLSPVEKSMQKHAKQPLVTEVRLSLGVEAAVPAHY